MFAGGAPSNRLKMAPTAAARGGRSGSRSKSSGPIQLSASRAAVATGLARPAPSVRPGPVRHDCLTPPPPPPAAPVGTGPAGRRARGSGRCRMAAVRPAVGG